MVSTSSTDGPGASDGPGATDGPGSTEGPGGTDGSRSGGGTGSAAGSVSTEGPTGPAEQPGRYQRSPGGMVGALIVTVLVILAFVAFRALNRSDLAVQPERVDYLSQVRIAQQETGRGVPHLVYPSRLPTGWYATQVTFAPDGTRPDLKLSILTPSDDYVGFVQSPDPVPVLLTTYVDAQPQAGRSVTVDGSVARRWDTWTDSGGDTALAAEHGGDSLLVFGTATRDQLRQLAASLTTARVAH